MASAAGLPSEPPRPGVSVDFSSDDERRVVFGQVLDYRGDVTLRLEDGSSVTGYVFSIEAQAGEPHVKMMNAASAGERMRVPLERITGVEFSGRDTADGRSWEAWVRRHEEKKRLLAQGIDIGEIEPQPDEL